MVTDRQNPVVVLGVLNRHYAWNMSGVREDKGGKRVLTAAELPKLGGCEVQMLDVGEDGG